MCCYSERSTSGLDRSLRCNGIGVLTSFNITAICLLIPQLSHRLANKDEPQLPISRHNYHSTGELSEFIECLLINVMRVAVPVHSD